MEFANFTTMLELKHQWVNALANCALDGNTRAQRTLELIDGKSLREQLRIILFAFPSFGA